MEWQIDSLASVPTWRSAGFPSANGFRRLPQACGGGAPRVKFGMDFSLLLATLALFLGSMLTFWLQPMTGRLLLPGYGGSASVWVVCLGTFQALLLAGYGYAYALSRLPARLQRLLHLALLLGGFVWVRLVWGAPTPLDAPSSGVAGAVVCDVLRLAAVPFILLAAGSTLLQAWLAAAGGSVEGGRGVYRLYAWSNLGSFAGLLLYSLGIEPFVGVGAQRATWSAAMALYALAVVAVAARTLRRAQVPSPFHVERSTLSVTPSSTSPLHFWFPCLSSALLVAVTTHVTQQVIALPLLWVLLLGAFLLSYVVGFCERAAAAGKCWRAATLLLLAGAPVCFLKHASFRVGVGVLAYGLILIFTAGVWLHGSLYAARPPAARLPHFYFLLALGGALGGALTSFAAPALLPAIWEFPLLLAATGAVAARGVLRSPAVGAMPRLIERAAALLAAGGVAASLWQGFVPDRGVRRQARDFYGAIAVVEQTVRSHDGVPSPMRLLVHGTVNHGQQVFRPGWESKPLSYFGPYSGAALAVTQHPRRGEPGGLRIGIVGLGIGTLAAYGLTGDTVVCYEISRPVLDVATNTVWFTYLANCPSRVELKLGDGRRLLEGERRANDPRFDVIYLDAFAGDSPPLHLVTREAFGLYLDRLAPGGVIAMNITNWHLNFLPLCKGVAREFGLVAQGFFTPEYKEQMQSDCLWVLLSREARDYTPHPAVRRVDWERVRDLPVPTDSRGSALRFIGGAAGASRSFR